MTISPTTVACARCGATVTALPEHDRPDRVTLCGPCGRAPFATDQPAEIAQPLSDLRRAAELAHEALGLAWAAEADPPLLEALTDLAELLDRATGRTP